MSVRINRTVDTVITFLECQLRGSWQQLEDFRHSQEFTNFRSNSIHCEVHLVRQDELVRKFHFKEDSFIKIGATAIKFRGQDVDEELTVDEDEQSGKITDKKVIFKIE